VECGSYFIKYCKTGETCNTLEATVSADLKAAPTSKPVRSTMKVQHTKCGPKNEDEGKFCDLMKEKVKKDIETFNKLPSTERQIVENLLTTCDQGNVIPCEKDCVDLNDHPGYILILLLVLPRYFDQSNLLEARPQDRKTIQIEQCTLFSILMPHRKIPTNHPVFKFNLLPLRDLINIISPRFPLHPS
jgi:hypothetical protein